MTSCCYLHSTWTNYICNLHEPKTIVILDNSISKIIANAPMETLDLTTHGQVGCDINYCLVIRNVSSFMDN
jgi:hypothetical protein